MGIGEGEQINQFDCADCWKYMRKIRERECHWQASTVGFTIFPNIAVIAVKKACALKLL